MKWRDTDEIKTLDTFGGYRLIEDRTPGMPWPVLYSILNPKTDVVGESTDGTAIRDAWDRAKRGTA